jgi:hypothetical protein
MGLGLFIGSIFIMPSANYIVAVNIRRALRLFWRLFSGGFFPKSKFEQKPKQADEMV